jgi:BMFP domain-containing protein YqiC
MGIFWELMQKEQRSKSESLEERVEQLETGLNKTQILLRKTLEALEHHIQKDVYGDGAF